MVRGPVTLANAVWLCLAITILILRLRFGEAGV
jgi:hypothetical protein